MSGAAQAGARRPALVASIGLFLLLVVALAAPTSADPPPRVLLETSMGEILVELDPETAPRTVANFLAYVRSRHYDGTIFHRVLAGQLIQGGGYDVELHRRPTRPPVVNEARPGRGNDRGTLAMARSTDDPDSATDQFFINTANNSHLNFKNPSRRGRGFTVFGRVVEGMDVVDAIARRPTISVRSFTHLPQQAVVLLRARLVGAGPGEEAAP